MISSSEPQNALASSTPRQVELWRALGLGPPPRYLHVPLVLDRDGRRLGKRHGSLSLRSVLDAGVSPEQLVGWLAWSAGIAETPAAVRAQDLIGSFRTDALTHEPTLLDDVDVERSLGLVHGAVGMDAAERAIGIEQMRAHPGQCAQADDDQQRRRPDHQLEAGRVVPFRLVAG